MSVSSGSDSESGPDTHQGFMQRAAATLPGSYRLAVHLLGDRTDAEDAVQEALVLAWRGWVRLRDIERFGPWFDRILVNVCYERLRGRRRSRSVVMPADAESTSADQFSAANARDAVGRALLRLTPEQRIVIVLRYWRDLSIEEIADRVGIPSGTVRSRLHYAMQILKKDIDRPLAEADVVPR